MAPGVATIMWKTVDGYKLSTGEHYSINDQVTFHNEGFADYFIDFSLDLQDYETIFVSMLGLTSFLSLFIHTGEDAFVGFARSGKIFTYSACPSLLTHFVSSSWTSSLGMRTQYRA